MRELLELICSLPDPSNEADYIKAWKKVGAAVSYHQFNLTKIFRGFFNSDPETPDFLTIIIPMLPNDKALLKKAKEKLDFATSVFIDHLPEERDEAKYCLTNIFAAVTYKLDPKPSPLPKEFETRATKVINEVRQIEQLLEACKDFTNSVMSDLKKIIARFPEIYSLYFSNTQLAPEDIFHTISNDMLSKKFPLKDDSPSLIPLNQKMTVFLALRDIYFTLKHAASHEGRAEELHQKLTTYKLILQQHTDNKPPQLFQNIQYFFSSKVRFFALYNQYQTPKESTAPQLKLGNP